jgi:hypothetical protein
MYRIAPRADLRFSASARAIVQLREDLKEVRRPQRPLGHLRLGAPAAVRHERKRPKG